MTVIILYSQVVIMSLYLQCKLLSHNINIGVYLSLGNQVISNNSQVNIKSLSSDHSSGALQCITDRSPCCLSSGRGEWYLPNAATIGGNSSATMYYTRRGDNGEVILN